MKTCLAFDLFVNLDLVHRELKQLMTSSGEKFAFYFSTLSGIRLLALLLKKKMVSMKMVCGFV